MIVLAFSGGLDTSFCVPFLKETYDDDVTTVTVDTGGLSESDKIALEEKALQLGAVQHFTLDAKQHLFDHILSYLIKGNIQKGQLYPLCVGPERVSQSIAVAQAALELNASMIAHGSTGAGNDQVRFDMALQLLAPGIKIVAPIRDFSLTRAQTTDYLKARGFDVPAKTTEYSINSGLWGTTIGGKETHTSELALPDDAFPITNSIDECPDEPVEVTVQFENGLPVGVDGIDASGVKVIERLNEVGSVHGIGRGVHVGDTILGIKGRVGFEAPGALMLIVAHRELEKIVLTKWQLFQKTQTADLYGMLLHEGQFFDPVMRDIESYLDSSQHVVTGEVRLRLHKGNLQVLGCSSPYSLFDTGVAVYGEENSGWGAEDARGFGKIMKNQAALAMAVQNTKGRMKSGLGHENAVTTNNGN
jgi:argininosuccinate synthase